MTDERLIEKAKAAISEYDIAKARRVSVSPDRLAVLLAEMVAVFEEAHTPTNDERREDFDAANAAFKARDEHATWGDPDDRDAAVRWHWRGFQDGVAFRRPASPESSAELTTERRHELAEGAVDAIEPCVTNRTAAYNTWNNLASDDRFVRAIVTFSGHRVAEPSTDEKLEWPEHWTINEKLRDLHARWHDQPGNLIEGCGWEGCEFWEAAKFTLRMADVRVIGREPQAEPSDEQVEAALQALGHARSGVTPPNMRAALRAAGVIGQEGEQNHG